MGDSGYKMIYYIQTTLYNGRQPDEDGYYRYSRKELADNSEISSSTASRNIEQVIDYFYGWCDLARWAKYKEYAGEILYTDVSYEKGVLKFKRNPLSFNPELSFLWGLPPLGKRFAYDAFDEKHRRRLNGNTMQYDAIPWDWDADQYEKELQRVREAIRLHQLGVKE